MGKTELLIFDLDGTLVDCKKLHQDSFRWAVKQHCPAAEFEDHKIEGRTTLQKIDYLRQKGYTVTDDIDATKKNYTRAHFESYIKFDHNVYSELRRLSENYYIALCSNSRSEFVFKCITVLDLWFFDLVYSRDYGPAKPDPWMYNQCMSRLMIDAAHTIIFEDSDIGIDGARRSGANVVVVKDTTDLIEKIKKL